MDLSMKILVAEDFKATRMMIVKTLNGLGFNNIAEAEDGEQATQILKKEPVDLIISDWNMPRKDGYELLVWVRSDEKCRDIPFIMATARGEKRQLLKTIEAGVSNFITKPFTSDELKRAIEQVFQKDKKNEDIPEKQELPHRTVPGKIRLKVAHIQITDHLILGVLKHLISERKLEPKYFDLETRCMSGWNPVQKALEIGLVDAAFILAPIAMDLFSGGVPIKLILFAHKNGSICVRKYTDNIQEPLDVFFKGKTFFIPHIMSVHHMISSVFLSELGLKPGLVGLTPDTNVIFEVVPPVKMPTFITQSPNICGFMVAQPVGKKAIAEGGAELLFLSGDMWEEHPCCVVAMRDDFIEAYPDAVQEFVNMLVEAGQFVEQYSEISAKIAVEFLDPDKTLHLTHPILEEVIKEKNGIKTDYLFPVIEDLDKIQRYMTENMGIGTMIDLEKFIDTQFAEIACKTGKFAKRPSVFHDPSDVVRKIIDEMS